MAPSASQIKQKNENKELLGLPIVRSPSLLSTELDSMRVETSSKSSSLLTCSAFEVKLYPNPQDEM